MAAARTVWFSFHLGCHRSALLLWLRQLPRCVDQTLLNFPHPRRAGPVLLTLLFFPLVLEWVYIYMWGGGLCILLHWSGPLVCSQLVFCVRFCVWRCIPDVSMEGDVLRIYLLLRHLVLCSHYFGFNGILICNNYPKVIVIPRETFVQMQNLL